MATIIDNQTNTIDSKDIPVVYPNPPANCIAPTPKEVPIPATILKIQRASIKFPIRPFTLSPISGYNAVLILKLFLQL
ncbi:hypothetical protein SDC9_172678 [bioreactor metagenome]|uniref:Uncharacterized protein n=1 Tax=bioreactor metagenome TaxID=1076179 RepID=A0A645GEC5_9ZZZZ